MNGTLNTFSGKQHPQWMEGVAFTKWLRIRKSTSWYMTLRTDYFWAHLIPVVHIWKISDYGLKELHGMCLE